MEICEYLYEIYARNYIEVHLTDKELEEIKLLRIYHPEYSTFIEAIINEVKNESG